MFTRQLIEEIKDKLYLLGKKDTEFDEVTDLNDDSYITLALNGENKKISTNRFLEICTQAIKDAEEDLWKTEEQIKQELNKIVENVLLHKFGITTQFGTEDTYAISQRTLTDAINRIWDKLDDISGESHYGMNISISPASFSSDTATIEINATTINGIKFDYIKFYLKYENEEYHLVFELEGTDSFHDFITINDTAYIKCEAKLLGSEAYIMEKKITKCGSFYVGAGTDPSEIVTDDNRVELDDNMEDHCVVTCNDNDYIFVVMKSDEGGFVGASMNGFRIPFLNREHIEGTDYDYYKSENKYYAGDYPISINE